MKTKTILITGCAGFIGYHLCNLLFLKNYKIVGIDNLSSYYDLNLKKNRLRLLKKKIKYYNISINNKKKIYTVFKKFKPNYVINLAAQAGVRYSLKNPSEYINTNIVGFHNLLECCKNFKVKHFLFASSSSVYGNIRHYPFNETQAILSPLSLYAASKGSNELIAHSYSSMFKIPITGLRFFTVYGEYGRPDMSLYIFAKNILKNKTTFLFNSGKMYRDFTYVGDVVHSIFLLLNKSPKKKIPYEVYNIGNGKKVFLRKYYKLLEYYMGKSGKVKFKKMQLGDVKKTWCNNSKLIKTTKYKPKVSINEGVKKFVNWFKKYYQLT